MQKIDLETLVENSLEIFRKAGFVAEAINYPSTRRSIDLVGAGSKHKIVAKIAIDTRHLSSMELFDLKKAAKAYNASPLIISLMDNKREIEDDVVVKKSGIYVVSPELLRNYLLSNEKPLVYREKGVYLVRVNPVKFRKRRLELNYSLGALALEIGVSRKAIYEYERGSTSLAINTAVKIAEILGEEVFEPIEILDPSIVENTPSDIPTNKLEKELKTLCRSSEECEFYKLVKTPIDYIIKDEEETYSFTLIRYGEARIKASEAIRIAQVVKTREYIIKSEKDIEELKHYFRN
ncbi:MAG: helix-turn-helix domain-containing protein [Thermoprotei archaeon]